MVGVIGKVAGRARTAMAAPRQAGGGLVGGAVGRAVGPRPGGGRAVGPRYGGGGVLGQTQSSARKAVGAVGRAAGPQPGAGAATSAFQAISKNQKSFGQMAAAGKARGVVSATQSRANNILRPPTTPGRIQTPRGNMGTAASRLRTPQQAPGAPRSVESAFGQAQRRLQPAMRAAPARRAAPRQRPAARMQPPARNRGRGTRGPWG